MNAFPDDRQGRSDEDLPLGPAMPRRGEFEREADDALLPPFAQGRDVPPAAPVGASAEPEDLEDPFSFQAGESEMERDEDDAGEELPWLVTAEEGEAARREDAAPSWADTAGASSGEGETASDGEMPAWLDLGGASFMEDETPGASSEPEPALVQGGGDASGEEAAEGAPALAERFESIARLLRARGVAGVLESGDRDPLGLLLTGFALGYLQRDEDAGS